MTTENKIKKYALISVLLLVACNVNKNLISSPEYKLKVKLPNKCRLLSKDEAESLHKKMDFGYYNTDMLKISYSVDGILVNVKPQNMSEKSRKTGTLRPFTLKDWEYLIKNAYEGTTLLDLSKAKINNVEYLTYSFEHTGLKNIPLDVKNIIGNNDYTSCWIEIVSKKEDSLKSRKVFDYVLQHLQNNKDTLAKSH